VQQELMKKLKEEVSSWDDANGLKSIVEQMEKTLSGNSLSRLLRKGGEFSITRTILIASWLLGLGLYVFGSLFAGAAVPLVGATVPIFDSTAFLAVTGAASSLYFSTHNINVGKKGQ
jgi:hypothetical protein